MGCIKGSIEIRLEQIVSEETLKKIALKLRDDESIKYDKLFIEYYLPEMELGAGAWATSHFTPDLDIIIFGLSIEGEKDLASKPKNISEKIIGQWIDRGALTGKYTFLERNNCIVMIINFQDGSNLEKEMTKKTDELGRVKFEEKEQNDFNEYYLIEKDSRLGLYDDQNHIRTLPLVQ
ncbi:MAG: hypothetical protein D3925_02290 [Candidatus Electrothrix sp. AR5]|nr:hypothetical protein [Candidatus Electrothrix sp. AR5]